MRDLLLTALFVTVTYLVAVKLGWLRAPRALRRRKVMQAVNPFQQAMPKHFWPEEWVKRAESNTFAHSDYQARLHAIHKETKGREKARDFKLKERMEKLYETSPASETRAAVAVMFENHLLPAYYVFVKAPDGDAAARKKYNSILDIIEENLSTLEQGQSAAVEMEQLVTLRHLEAVREALKPRRSDLDL